MRDLMADVERAHESDYSTTVVITELHQDLAVAESANNILRREIEALNKFHKEEQKRTIAELEHIVWAVKTFMGSEAYSIKGKAFYIVLLGALQTALNTMIEYMPF